MAGSHIATTPYQTITLKLKDGGPVVGFWILSRVLTGDML
jgi:hypothetical protein